LKKKPTWHDEQFINDIESKPFYGRRLDGYVLAELEIAVHRSNPFNPEQLEEITVDHLAPQSLKGDWKKMFPKDKGEREMLLGLLGNLVPLSQSDNSAKGAKDWNEAGCRLRNETIYRTAREVLDQYAEWGPQQIHERTKQLAELAVTRWPQQG
ncbi:MAG: HNH endonuclease family protein, partial [Caldilineaceae bacterium]|nr:HNH endonuclease family protein [Caldilineaceae bacterium]